LSIAVTRGHWPGLPRAGARVFSAARAVALALLLALLPACSAVRIGYNQADALLAWMADDYFDLDAAQKQDFDSRIKRLLQWHRHEQLPDYARFLDEVKRRGRQQFTADDVTWMVNGVKARYRVIAQRGAGDAAELLATMTPDNLQALEKHFEKVNQKFIREYKATGTQEERKRSRLQRTLKLVREWAGSLTREQEQRITALNDAIPSADDLRHKDRLRRQKEFLTLLNLRHDKTRFAPQLRAWLSNWEDGRSPDYEKVQAKIFDLRVALYLEVEQMLTPKQREHVLQRLQSYIDDIRALADQRLATN